MFLLGQTQINVTEGENITLPYPLGFSNEGSININVTRVTVRIKPQAKNIGTCTSDNNMCVGGDVDERITPTASFGNTINATVVIRNAQMNDSGEYIAAVTASFSDVSVSTTATLIVFVTPAGEHTV